MRHTVFLFGEAEKGDFCTPIFCKTLPQLADLVGNPPEESQGIFYAIQALLYQRDLIFFRVKEEGFSTQDYMRGLRMLQNKELAIEPSAICMPGVGDTEIIQASTPICTLYKSLLILQERDLYDFLTN